MTQAPPTEKTKLARLAVLRARQSAMNLVMRSPFYRFRVTGPRATEVLFIPQDLRTTDPTFVTEFEHGQVGLAGVVAGLHGRSPFDIAPPNAIWEQQLHAFDWLRHMRAATDEGGDIIAKRLVAEWIERHGSPRGVAFHPSVTARRVISWLSCAGTLLAEASPRAYSDYLHSLDVQLMHLATTYGQAPTTLERLKALMALVYAGLCLADKERLLELHEPLFLDQLERFILPTGSPITRSSAGMADVLLDLLPIAQCYVARDREPPAAIGAAIKRLFPWLRYMRMGDGQLARFHGAGSPEPAGLATALAYDDSMQQLTPSPELGFLRCEAGRTIVLMDAGPPPPLEAASEAHAGCLSFELSSGTQLIVVNCGMPASAHQELRRLSRSTAAHSTLAIEGASSAQLVKSALLGSQPGIEALAGLANVQSRYQVLAGGALDVSASHNGYVSRFEVVHWRDLRLSADGNGLDGRDRLAHPDSSQRIKGDIPFGIHFHLHPDVDARLGSETGTAELTLLNGETWRLMARGDASLTFEDSMFLGDSSGPKRALQIVLRGRCLDQAEVLWRFERTGTAPPPEKRRT